LFVTFRLGATSTFCNKEFVATKTEPKVTTLELTLLVTLALQRHLGVTDTSNGGILKEKNTF